MTDKLLLELAAKAAEIEHGTDRIDSALSLTAAAGRHVSFPQWNPLIDDGDALRLAVKLKLHVDVHMGGVTVWVIKRTPHENTTYYEENTGDDLADTRRAIVRAAAAIGMHVL